MKDFKGFYSLHTWILVSVLILMYSYYVKDFFIVLRLCGLVELLY